VREAVLLGPRLTNRVRRTERGRPVDGRAAAERLGRHDRHGARLGDEEAVAHKFVAERVLGRRPLARVRLVLAELDDEHIVAALRETLRDDTAATARADDEDVRAEELVVDRDLLELVLPTSALARHRLSAPRTAARRDPSAPRTAGRR